ncbi:MAG: SDR family oxidoreductase [Anaerolineaceae bacterium]|nr:SDR family oxidoreductase [Anaerolineaceae bacterium]
MLLSNKNAVIYGGGGAVGSAVARAFAAEGAHVFLVGRTLPKLEKVAQEIAEAGGKASTAQADAMDEQSVANQLNDMVQKVGTVDISFNLILLDDIQGASILDMPRDQFLMPVFNAVNTHYITGTAAGRVMMKQKSGVILALTANAARRPSANLGGFGIACAAIEGICRQLAVELGANGIRVVCLRSSGSPDAPGLDEILTMNAKMQGISREELEINFAASTLLKRLPRLAEVANAAVLMASDKASAITAAVTNITCGELMD